jgi:pyruvyltransferase
MGYRGDTSPTNFGDALTPAMFRAWNIPFEYSDEFDTIGIGSIAKVARPGTRVLGSGIMSSKDGCDSRAEWLWVRGPRTRAKVVACGGTCPELYGDMAMLLPLLVDESAKRYDVGIVPHMLQLDQARALYPQHRIIDLRTEDAFRTVREITECRTILSSSLHGIITAHAYGIPAAHIDLGIPIKGDGVKFKDHYDAIGSQHVQSTVEEPVFSTGRIDLQPLRDILISLRD